MVITINTIKACQNITEIRPVILASFGPPSQICIRSWGRLGCRTGLISIQKVTDPKPLSSYLGDFVLLPPEKLYTDEGIKIIVDFLDNFNATGITCIDEKVACWINDSRPMLPQNTKVWLPENKTIRDILSKQKQIEIARAVDFKLLPTYLLSPQNMADISIPPEHFPLCLRPGVPNSVEPNFKVFLSHTYEDLTEYLGSLKIVREPIIAQPFLNVPNLVVHGCRNQSGESFGLEAFIINHKFEGFALTLAPFELSDDLRQKCIAFADVNNIVGNYHYDLLFDSVSKTPYFLELNCRFGGTTAKVYACGYDEPKLALQAYGVQINYKPDILFKIVSSKRALVKYLLYTVRNKLSSLDYPVKPLWKRIPETLWGLIYYKDDIFDIRDIPGSFSAYFGTVRRLFKQFPRQVSRSLAPKSRI